MSTMSASKQQLVGYLWNAISQARSYVATGDAVRYVIGLLLLRHICDQLEERKKEHPRTTDGAEKAAKASSVTWPKVRWGQIRSALVPAEELRRTVEALQFHPDYREAGELLATLGLPKIASESELCREFIETVSDIDLRDVTNEDLASLNNRLIEMWADAAGARSGEFYTPPNLSLLMADLLTPEAGSTVYDPTCGTGSLLLAAHQRSMRVTGGDSQPQLFGQEINSQTTAVARANFFLWGLSPESILTGNTLTQPRFLQGNLVREFDYVIAHPPVGVRLTESEAYHLERDLRFSYGIPAQAADFAFIQHIIASLNERGRAVVLVSPRTLFVSGREGQIRKAIIEDDLIEAVITLPGNLLLNTGAPTAILILNRLKSERQKGKILLVYADEEYESRERGRNTIADHNRNRIVEAVKRWEEEDRFAAVATLEAIRSSDYVLMPASYIDLIDIDSFMGGNFRWNELSKIADVFQGTRLGRQPRGTGATPAMQGRDLSITDLTVNDLAMVSVPSDLPNPVYSEVGDILIQRIGQRPHAFLVEDELKGVLVKDTVYVVRLHHKDPLTAQYLIEFLNSDIGQALLSTLVGGAVIPTLRLTDLRRLRLPIPEKAVIELINDLHEVEQALSDRINHTRNLRRRLFSIKDPEQVEGQLRTLSTEAQVLAASLMQVDDLDFQIRNFYPFPLAYAHRALNAITEPSQRYQEQLRVAENILAFLASIGLAFVAYMQALSTPEKSNLTENSLSDCWKGGISPGSWQDIAYHSGSSLRGNRAVAAVNSFASIWFRGSGRRASRFTELTQQIVRIKNDHKHDRGPKTPQEYKEAVRSMDKHLRQCLEPLAFFVQYPIRLVRRIDIDWRTGQCLLNTLVYAGDHPGLRQERAVLSEPLPCDKLYLELGTDQWMPLYPVISVEYCPSCKAHETYFIDRWDGSEQYVELKSFERGHTHQNNDTAKRVGSDLEHWLREHFSKN